MLCRPVSLSEPEEALALASSGDLLMGVDEAGRGPIAGPVVAAAVVLRLGDRIPRVNDSKHLTASSREELFQILAHSVVAVATAVVGAEQIDRINILRATHLAMQEAVRSVAVKPKLILVDGYAVPNLPFPQVPLIRGDQRSLCIAAASIVAKVTRDRIMHDLDTKYPGYGFAAHKGYPTREHIRRLKELGPCPEHRRSFSPVKRVIAEMSGLFGPV
ncbi:MAG: ribonuclease HII [Armatimonadota bacterium]